MPRFIVTAVKRSFGVGQPVISDGAAAISIRLVASPCPTRPATKKPGTGAQAASSEETTKSDEKPSSMRLPGSRWISCTEATVPKQ